MIGPLSHGDDVKEKPKAGSQGNNTEPKKEPVVRDSYSYNFSHWGRYIYVQFCDTSINQTLCLTDTTLGNDQTFLDVFTAKRTSIQQTLFFNCTVHQARF